MPKNKNLPKRYAIYLRCSTDDQKEKDFSTIDAQREINHEHIRMNGGVIVHEYADAGISGTTLKRPQFQALLKDAQAGAFDAVLVTYMSRLGRGKIFDIAEYEINKSHVRVEMVKEHFSDDLAGYMGKSMTTMMDGMYPKMISGWTKTKMRQMVANGYVTGFTPIGYIKEYVTAQTENDEKKPPQRLVPCPNTAPLIQAAFELFADCGNSQRVREFLNANLPRPITAKRNNPNWSLQSTINLLACETYLGVQRLGECVNETAHEPIISRELWDAVRERAKITAKRFHGTHSDASEGRKNGFYLRGLIRCAACGCAMSPATRTGRSGGEVRYYECINSVKGISKCPVKRVNADSLHEVVYSEIRRAAETPTRLDTIIRDSVKLIKPAEQLNAELITLRRSIKNKEREIGNVVGAIAASKAGRALLSKLTDLENQKAELESDAARIATTVHEHTVNRPDADSVRALWARFGELYRTADDAGKSRLLPLLVEGVEMTEKERGAVKLVFQPNVTASRSLVGEFAKVGCGSWI